MCLITNTIKLFEIYCVCKSQMSRQIPKMFGSRKPMPTPTHTYTHTHTHAAEMKGVRGPSFPGEKDGSQAWVKLNQSGELP